MVLVILLCCVVVLLSVCLLPFEFGVLLYLCAVLFICFVCDLIWCFELLADFAFW